MNDTKTPESAYSAEPTSVTGPNSLRSKTATAKPAETVKPVKGEPSQAVNPAPSATETPKIQTATQAEIPIASAPYPATGFVEYLNQTKWIWLGLAGAFLGFMALVTVQKGMAERARISRDKRHETAVATVTPESLIERCGPAAGDATKEMYPVLMRTMVYAAPESERIVFEFSRTAEEKSDWVFLSMKNEGGSRKYETPEEKIAGLPCLDLRK